MKLTRLTLGAAFALGLALTIGCSSIRSTAMSWSNDDKLGDPAPAFDSGDWVAADFWGTPDEPKTDWRMLVVFKPT